jgi:hypothetical protein
MANAIRRFPKILNATLTKYKFNVKLTENFIPIKQNASTIMLKV